MNKTTLAAPYRASDPVAEAFKAAVYAYGGEAIEGENFNSAVAVLRDMLIEHVSTTTAGVSV